MHSCSPTLSQISLKNSFRKVVFQILAKIEMMRNKNRLFGHHFETVQYFQFLFAELWFFIVHTYIVQISLQNSGGKVVFLRGPWNPLGNNESKSTLVTYGVITGCLQPIGHSVLLPWIQTKLSWKPEIVFNKSKRIIWACSFVKKRRLVFFFLSIFLRNRSLSDARWFCGKKTQIWEGKSVFNWKSIKLKRNVLCFR